MRWQRVETETSHRAPCQKEGEGEGQNVRRAAMKGGKAGGGALTDEGSATSCLGASWSGRGYHTISAGKTIRKA